MTTTKAAMYTDKERRVNEGERHHRKPILSPRHGASSTSESMRPLSAVMQSPWPATRTAAEGGELTMKLSLASRQNIAPLGRGIGRRHLSRGGLTLDLAALRPSRVAPEAISPHRIKMDFGPPKLVRQNSDEFEYRSRNFKDLSGIMSDDVLMLRGADPVHEFARISLNSKPCLTADTCNVPGLKTYVQTYV